MAVQEFVAAARELSELLTGESLPRVAVLGSFNCGKSTLVNGLLGEEISPVGVLPTTAGPVSFRYGASFKAKVTFAGKSSTFTDRQGCLQYLARAKNNYKKVDIELPSSLLKQCNLIDMPGLDYPSGGAENLALETAAGADLVIYLFHQRGLDNSNRTFIQKMAPLFRGGDGRGISFWLNCNHGPCDGSSLKSTGEFLHRIFLYPVETHAVNLFDPESVKAVLLFLEVELACILNRRAGEKLKELDRAIPGELAKTAWIKDDLLFLSEFWNVWGTAAKIIAAGRLLSGLPPVRRELNSILASISEKNILLRAKSASGKPPRLRVDGPGETKRLFLSLVENLQQDHVVGECLSPRDLGKITGRILDERFSVITAGGFSTGKSTFLNALMKEEILPAADSPTTTAITRISHGPARTATLRFALQATLPLYEIEGKRAAFCRDEVSVLERWLDENLREIAGIEAETDGLYQMVCPARLKEIIGLTKKTFSAGNSSGPARPGAPSFIFRLLPAKFLPYGKAARTVRVTFKDAPIIRLDLATLEGRREFYKMAGPENAFRLEAVNLTCPAEYLKLATFVDTPGLDSTQRFHREKALKHLEESDACLVFFNGRQVLTGLEREIVRGEPAGSPFTGGISWPAQEKTFYVINFADTLTAAQREAVYNYLRQNLDVSCAAGNGSGITMAQAPRIFLVSAMAGLKGNGGGLAPFLKNLEDFVTRRRKVKFYGPLADEIDGLLAAAMAGADEALKSPGAAYGEKKKSREALGRLRQYRRELKNIKNAIFHPGGF